MKCERCEGLMVKDGYSGIYHGEKSSYMALKCLNCGDVVDPQIVKQRLLRRQSFSSPGVLMPALRH